MSEYIEDDLPLPSFEELFGDNFSYNNNYNNNFDDISFKKQKTSSTSNKMTNDAQSFDSLITHTTAHTLPLPLSTLPPIIMTTTPSSSSSAGRWTDEEHQLFLQGVRTYGRDWKAMVPLIKTRSIIQIRTHAQKVFKKDSGSHKTNTHDNTYNNYTTNNSINNNNMFDLSQYAHTSSITNSISHTTGEGSSSAIDGNGS